MRVIHIVHGKVNPNGANGISRVVYHLNRQERELGIDSEIWAVVDGEQCHRSFRRDEFVTVECFPRVRFPFGKQEIIEKLLSEQETIDLVHFHMIWFFDKNIIGSALRRAGMKYIITTHGTYLKPHARSGKRSLARVLYELNYLNGATEIHAITHEEARALKGYGYFGPTFVAPNGIALDGIPVQRDREALGPPTSQAPAKLLWVGVKRADKNLESLIRALAVLPAQARNKVKLYLVGPDNKGNEARYRKLAKKLGVDSHVEFRGAVYGQEKYDLIESCDVHVLPSLSEVFALAMLDAMACSKPCLVSEGCGYGPWQDDDFCISFRPNPIDIAGAIVHMMERRSEWPAMGLRARDVIERDLNWQSTAKTMQGNYERICRR